MLPSGATAGPSVSPPLIFAVRVKSFSSFASAGTIESPVGFGTSAKAYAARLAQISGSSVARRIEDSGGRSRGDALQAIGAADRGEATRLYFCLQAARLSEARRPGCSLGHPGNHGTDRRPGAAQLAASERCCRAGWWWITSHHTSQAVISSARRISE